MPLALLAQWAVATVADSRTVEHAQTAIRFAALLSGTQRFALWTQQHAVGLEREVLPGEAPRLPRQSDGRWAVALLRGWVRPSPGCARNGGSKLGGAQRLRGELMPQFEPEVPGPLCHHLPALLSPGRVRAPTVGIDLLIFIRECRLKGSTMQIQSSARQRR
jgi:hypothetical protein